MRTGLSNAQLSMPQALARVPRRRKRSERWLVLLLLSPSLLAVGIFVYGFIAWTVYVSLSKWNSLNPDFSFAGLQNYIQLFRDFRFLSDLRNTLVFTVCFIAISIGIGLTLALLIDRHIRGEGIFRTLFLFPMSLSFVVTGIVWQWLLNPTTGINLLLKKLGVDHPPLWYVDTRVVPGWQWLSVEWGLPLALLAVILAATWQMSGFAMALYLAGLRAIPEELREAARVDGASEWTIVRKILLPQLRPITVAAIVILGHISLKIFDLVYTMTGPGAKFVTDMPGVYMFEAAFRGNQYATGAAIAIVMLVLTVCLVLPYVIRSVRQEGSG